MATPQMNPNQEIESAYAKLQQMVGAMPQIDFERMYAPLIQKVQAQPETQMPSPMRTFAAAVGDPQGTRNMLQSRFEQISKEKGGKRVETLGLQEKALQGHIGQLMEKGKFKQALGQSETLAKLQDSLERIGKEEDLTRQIKLEEEKSMLRRDEEDVKAGNRRALLEQKEKHAMARVQERLKTMRELSPSQRDQYTKIMESLVTKLAGEQDIAGDALYSKEQVAQMALDYLPTIVQGANKLREGAGKTAPATPPRAVTSSEDGDFDPDAPALEPGEGNDPIRAAHQKLYGKKKK